MRLNNIVSYVFGSLTLAGFSAQTALALPLGDAAEAQSRPTPAFAEYAASGVDFTAILALSNCSGSLVRFTTSKSDDKAMALTNGHCYEGGFLNPGQVVVNEDSSRTFDLLTADASDTLGTLNASTILYATMTDTDVTLYRLTQTYAEIENQYNVKPLTISAKHANKGDPIRVVSGFWKKIYACNIDNFVYSLHEGDWIFRDSIRYTKNGCKVIGGTSGSPIVNADSHEVIGINNTINESGGHCTQNNPCEVDEQGAVSVKQGVGYGEELVNFYSCLNATNDIDLSRPGCALPKPN